MVSSVGSEEDRVVLSSIGCPSSSSRSGEKRIPLDSLAPVSVVSEVTSPGTCTSMTKWWRIFPMTKSQMDRSVNGFGTMVFQYANRGSSRSEAWIPDSRSAFPVSIHALAFSVSWTSWNSFRIIESGGSLSISVEGLHVVQAGEEAGLVGEDVL